jgi:hypothetical protein
MDLRLRIVRAVAQGSSIRGAARRFARSPWAAIKLMPRVRATGSPAPARAPAGIGARAWSRLRPTSKGLSRRRPISRSPSCRRRCSAASASPPGSRRSTARSAGPARGIKKSLRAAEQVRPAVAHQRRRHPRDIKRGVLRSSIKQAGVTSSSST